MVIGHPKKSSSDLTKNPYFPLQAHVLAFLLLIGTNLGFLQNKKTKTKKFIQSLILGARAFARATKKNVPFIIYATPMGTSIEKGVQKIPMQYYDFNDVFKKKNVDNY